MRSSLSDGRLGCGRWVSRHAAICLGVSPFCGRALFPAARGKGRGSCGAGGTAGPAWRGQEGTLPGSSEHTQACGEERPAPLWGPRRAGERPRPQPLPRCYCFQVTAEEGLVLPQFPSHVSCAGGQLFGLGSLESRQAYSRPSAMPDLKVPWRPAPASQKQGFVWVWNHRLALYF